MDRAVFTKAKAGKAPGRKEYKRWRKKVLLGCPNCGVRFSIDRTIDKTGNVLLIVQCPSDGCAFQEYVTLEGYNRK